MPGSRSNAPPEVVAGHALSDDWGSCVVCGTRLPQNVNVRVRLSNSRQLRECSSCGTWTYFPRQGSVEQAAIHNDHRYFEHPYFHLRRTINEDQRRRCRNIFAHLETAVSKASLRGQRWLDVGCDTGLLLRVAAEELGIIPVGIDVAERAISRATEQGIEAYQTTLEHAPAPLCDFAVITAVDLIEHVTDPISFLTEIRKRLRPGGVTYLETPNIRSAIYAAGRILFRMSGGRPAALVDRLFPPQHIQYFTRASFADAANAAGLELVRLDTRSLPNVDVAASVPVRAAISALQLVDHLTRDRILIRALMRRPFY